MLNKEKSKILIIGGDGMAGSMISHFLREQNYNVHLTTRRSVDKETTHFLDVLVDLPQLKYIIEKVKPVFVINCIGILNSVAEDHKSMAVLINSYLPHYIDDLSRELSFKFIHISTDCVFSGKKGQYIETDLPDATSFYGQSKALGEIKNDANLTFRTSIIGPDQNKKGIGLFNWFMGSKGEIKGFDEVVWSGVTTLELAKAIEKSFALDVTGLYHLVNNDTINKYDLLLLLKKAMNKNIIITSDSAYHSNKSLVNSRSDFSFGVPSYSEMINEMNEWISNHRELYKHYL